MFYYVKKFFHFLLILILFALLIVLIYLGIQDINGSKGKEYLLDKYGYSKYKLYAYRVIEYDSNSNCADSWFKECTTDENVEKKILFITLEKEKIEVIQNKDGSFLDNKNE